MNTILELKNPHLKSILEKLVIADEALEKLKLHSEKISGFDNGLKFLPLKNVKTTIPSVESFGKPTSNYSNKYNVEKAHKEFNLFIEQIEKEIKEVEEYNTDSIKHNESICQIIKAVMQNLGIKEIYTIYERKYSRGNYKTKETNHRAGYLDDLKRVCPTSNTESIKYYLKELKNNFIYHIKKIEDQEKETLKQVIKEENDRAAQFLLENPSFISDMLIFGLDASNEIQNSTHKMKRIKFLIEEALDNLLSQNKYLHLAHFLVKNRGDWNEGYSYAQSGLMGFTIETEDDKLIYDEINGIIHDSSDGIDGRKFRDCNWNYSVLFGMVDKDILNKYNIIQKYL